MGFLHSISVATHSLYALELRLPASPSGIPVSLHTHADLIDHTYPSLVSPPANNASDYRISKHYFLVELTVIHDPCSQPIASETRSLCFMFTVPNKCSCL